MTYATLPAPAEAPPLAEAAEKRRLGIAFWICIAWLLLMVALAILAPYLPIKNPRLNFTHRGQAGASKGPSAAHWFGTDKDARDVFARTVYGARVSLTVGFVAIGFGMLVGGTLGILSGYFRGWWDRCFSFLFLVLLSFPSLVLAIMLTALLDRKLFTIAMILGVLAIAPVGRLARATTLQFAEREFVMAARSLGAKNKRIIVRELLPNVAIPMSALALLGMAVSLGKI